MTNRMTNQEASKVIKDGIDDMSLDYFDNEQYEALTIAIKALEQEPCDDAISREAVDKYIARLLSGYLYDGERERLEIFSAYLWELPSVTQKSGKWIPVSERLPEDNELVLFSTKTDRVFEGRYFADNTDRQWYSFRDETFAWNNVVTAWMPLPKPYKPQESEDKE